MWAVGSQQLIRTWLRSCLGRKPRGNVCLMRCFLHALPTALLFSMWLQAG